MRKPCLGGVVFSALVLAALPARATFHIMVIDEVFPGFEQAPDAQFVVLRMEAGAQVAVHGQPITTFDASGNSLPPFAQFCSTPASACSLPKVSPACAANDCTSPLEANDHRVLIATARARDLFCVTPDLLATGSIPVPDGRVCFGDVGTFAPSCVASGPVDCVAYGDFAGNNGIFGTPAAALSPGVDLEGVGARTAQCSPARSAAAVCVGGSQANMACTGQPTDCPTGACFQCPSGSCENFLDDSIGFSLEVYRPGFSREPENYHGDLGWAGMAGDAAGTGELVVGQVDNVASLLFQFDRRCDPGLDFHRRGTDANLDTRISAADIVATIQVVTGTTAAVP